MNINTRTILFMAFSLNSLLGQSLLITSPASGTVANPGQTLTVSVMASGGTFQQVYILGQDPIPISQPLSSPPYQFTIQVPTNIRPDRYTLTAGGFTSPGQGFDSDPIDIDIERPDNPISIRVEPSILELTPGETTLALLNDQGVVSSSTTADGTVATIDGVPAANGQLQLTAVNTLEGPMAFALYKAPTDFDRSGVDDNSASRTVSFQITSLTGRPNLVSAPVTIWRGPIVLVHGLWGDPTDWNGFTTFITDSRFNDTNFNIRKTNYNRPIPGILTNVTPAYNSLLLLAATTNSLGFAYNAPAVLSDIKEAIRDFRQLRQAAATQADVVAHSMGGTIVRTLEYLPGYADTSSNGVGSIHKLITIGTPHLGSPLATQLIQDNACVRGALAGNLRFAIGAATLNGAPVTGGVDDLQGDGSNDSSLSPALQAIQSPISNQQAVPTVMIAAKMTSSNTATLNSGAGFGIHSACGGSFLGDNLTPTGWFNVFSGDSDAIVPVSSQTNGLSNQVVVAGVIHSSGLTQLSFTGPGELDGLGGATIQTAVIAALNASVQNPVFVQLY